eukprot:scaffold1752_cov197-Alexandrium_tamarense.AAC.24
METIEPLKDRKLLQLSHFAVLFPAILVSLQAPTSTMWWGSQLNGAQSPDLTFRYKYIVFTTINST